ncbi:isochorismate synthase [Lactobacillaceae bacterium L1_55_11]|nr:isochorismate synthase [Lactobacillaceae bacterium L1_55_11]
MSVKKIINGADYPGIRKRLLEKMGQADPAFYFTNPGRELEIFAFGARQSWSDLSRVPADLGHDIVVGGQNFADQSNPDLADNDLMTSFWFLPEVTVIQQDNHFEVILPDGWDLVTWLRKTKTGEIGHNQITQISDETDWPKRVGALINHLQANPDLKKVVFGRQRQIQLAQPFNLATVWPQFLNGQGGYRIVLKRGDHHFISASPETLLKVESGHIQTAAVAGTIASSQNPKTNQTLGQNLLTSAKNQQEHAYVRDTILQQLQPWTQQLNWPNSPQLLASQGVQHLYTPICGQVNDNFNFTRVLTELNPTPALGGVPRLAALEYINQHEQFKRGLFAGPLGYFKGPQVGEMAVGIRSMMVTNQRARLFAGAGILADSNAEEEWAETNLKFKPMTELLEGTR